MQFNERYFPVVGMRCAACAEKVEHVVAHAVGVESAAVLYTERILHVCYRPTETSPEALAKVVEGVGFELILADTEYELAEQHRKALLEDAKRMRRNLIGAWVATLLMMLLMLLPFPHLVHQLGMALAAASVYFFLLQTTIGLPFGRLYMGFSLWILWFHSVLRFRLSPEYLPFGGMGNFYRRTYLF